MGLQNDFKPAFAQYSISIPPENIKFSEVFKVLEMEHWTKMG